MTKTLDENFRDWEGDLFGFGYGSGEPHILPALKVFLSAFRDERTYDYETLEEAVTPPVAWLLINALCKADVIEYGTSPRFGWLTPRGEAVKRYIDKHTAEQLVDVVCDYDSEEYVHCYPTVCNCGPDGYVDGAVCPNPFWGTSR